MASRSQADFKRKYSWWWNSHISPKNSKWLQENLTDMDAKVKQMIKLIEEDADSFARRAEMYYKKRPELMKLVEEFYRAYRALAERYDHATVVLRQAHRTMAEAFPSQVPFGLVDDLPVGSVPDGEPRTPDMPPIRAFVDPNYLQEDASGFSSSESTTSKRNGAFTEESDNGTERKGLKQLNDIFGNQAKFAEGRARKVLNFFGADGKECSIQDSGSHDLRVRVPFESERVSNAELEIVTLKNALAKLEAEKESSLVQYHHSLERLSNLESEVSRAREDSVGLNKRASKAESEVQNLKEALAKLETEREASVLQYQQCLDKISNLENSIFLAQKDAGELSNRASKAEIEAHSLKEDLDRLEAEKEAFLVQHKQGLEKISYLEGKLQLAEEDAERFYKRAEEAEGEVENLKQTLVKLTAEKEAAAVQYQECLERISILEHELASAEEEVRRLNSNIDDGIAKFKDAEGRCLLLERSNQTMHSELESLSQKIVAQSEELTDNQKELGRLWTCIQEERLRFMEAETAFQTLQHLHSQSQEELRSMAAEFQTRTQMLESLELRNQNLQNEVEQVKVENKGLNEVNLTSALTIQNLQDEIARLRETIEKLEAEVELRVDQRNALQQEIYCLKEEINDLNKKNQCIVDQVESVGFSQETFVSSVKDLQEENLSLKEGCERERGEKVSLQEKLEAMEKLVDKSALLENSLSDLNVELEEVREKVKGLEESRDSLLADKSALVSETTTLVSQLQNATDNLVKLTEKNNLLETSLLAANAELEGLRLKLKSLEDSYLLLENEKSDLDAAKGGLFSELDITQQRLVDLQKNFTELEENYFSLEKEKESTLTDVRELRVCLDGQKMEYASLAQLSESQLAVLESKIRLLEKEAQCIKKEYEEELDRTVNDEMEIFVLQGCVRDLEEKNCSLLHQCHTLLGASKLSDKLISELESEKFEQEMEAKSLFNQLNVLRMGLYRVLKTLDPDACVWYEEKAEQDHTLLKYVHDKLQETEDFLLKNQQLAIENSVLATLLQQLQAEVANLVAAKNTVDRDLRTMTEQFLALQSESQNLVEMNEELRLKVIEGDGKEEVLKVELKILQGQLLDVQGTCRNLEEENCKVLDEHRFLTKSISDLREEKFRLEEENCVALVEMVSQDSLSLILKDIILDVSLEMKELTDNLDKLNDANDCLKEKAKTMEVELEKLHAVEYEKTELHKMVEDLKWKYSEIELIRADQEKRIFKLSSDYNQQSQELKCIHEEKHKLETELCKLQEAYVQTKSREECLNHELQKEKNEIEAWESQAAALLVELQLSAIRGSIFEAKVHELSEIELIRADQEKRISKLSGDYNQQSQELKCIHEEKQKLETELCKFQEAYVQTKSREECLNHELQKERNEIEVWESQAAALLVELQLSAIRGSIFEAKFHELSEIELIRADQEKRFFKLSGDYNQQSQELKCSHEEKQKLETELCKLHEAYVQTKSREECLNHELQKERNEIEVWESQAAALFVELQLSAIRGSIFEAKFHELCEIELIRADQEKMIFKLSGDYNQQSQELCKLHEAYVQTKSREECLNHELQKERNEIEVWESQAAAFFVELQLSGIRDSIFEAKVHELSEAYEGLQDKICEKAVEVDQLKERACGLQCKNKELEEQMTVYVKGLLSLKDCLTSLENHTLPLSNPYEVDATKLQEGASFVHAEGRQQMSEEQNAMVPGGLTDLQELQIRITTIEKAVMEKERLVMLENSTVNSKLEGAMRQIEKLKSSSSFCGERVEMGKQKPTHEITEEGNEDVMTKDIVLDQISECSSYGISRRETLEPDDKMLEMWETADQDGSLDPTVGKAQKVTTAPSRKKHNKEHPSSESLAEKDIGVEKLEISKRFSGSHQEGNEKKILERLDSDAQKLTNLQITVQDLKRKVEVTEKSKRGKGMEFDSVKEQLDESEEAVMKLFDVNRKLLNSVEDYSKSFEEKSASAPDESGTIGRREISEQARMVSEKIGRLQLEVQKLQFLLLKLDDENKNRAKTRMAESKTRVLLRDYLYGKLRTSLKPKKRHFCACVQPATKGD